MLQIGNEVRFRIQNGPLSLIRTRISEVQRFNRVEQSPIQNDFHSLFVAIYFVFNFSPAVPKLPEEKPEIEKDLYTPYFFLYM